MTRTGFYLDQVTHPIFYLDQETWTIFHLDQETWTENEKFVGYERHWWWQSLLELLKQTPITGKKNPQWTKIRK